MKKMRQEETLYMEQKSIKKIIVHGRSKTYTQEDLKKRL
jgi:hypothetical protein